MIKLDKVNKYYFKGKSNQIHVIDNTSMELPDKGIVCLLGPSGCGKTTLLNAMGGLDKVDMGTIIVDGEQITRKSSNVVDSVRNAKIGYIFQNYNLLDDRTVFDNVAIALRLVGITDQKIIDERVKYCLDSVGIYQYRKKYAGSLSGGQRQRVAIARALVKNPKIIIADEPTGNLDSANTLEIMNIIKAISRERLVVLVTHETKIAEFYSDYVAEMSDGKITKAYSNDSSKYLDCRLDNKIYLQDMEVQKAFGGDDCPIEIYADDSVNTKIKVVIRDGNIYIDTGGKFNLVDGNADVELIDDNYKAMDESFFEETDFDYGACLPENFEPSYNQLFGFKRMMSNGFESVRNFKKIKKFLLLGFVFAAMFSFLAISNVIGIVDVQPKDYMTTNPNYIRVSNPNRSEELFELVEALDGVKYLIPGDSKISVQLPIDDYYQTAQAYETLNVSLAYTSVLDKEQIITGRMPQKSNEVVIDKTVADNFFKSSGSRSVGITKKRQLIGRRIQIPKMEDFVICGISDTQTPTMYVMEDQAINVLANAKSQVDMDDVSATEQQAEVSGTSLMDVKLAPKDLELKKGSLPKEKYEVILDSSREGSTEIGKTMDAKISGNKLKVVGYYTSKESTDAYYATQETVKAYYTSQNKYFTVYSTHPDATLVMLEKAKLSAKINADSDKAAYIRRMGSSLKAAFIVAALILFISLIEMYLMLRSSFLARIKEVGILRAIGVKKKDIYRMFTGEILSISLITAIPGILIMYFLLYYIAKTTDYLEGLYMVSPLVALLTFGILILFNLLAGLIPVSRTLRKTPAEILARIDI